MRRSIRTLSLVLLVLFVSIFVLSGCAGYSALTTLLNKTGSVAQVQPSSSEVTAPDRSQGDDSTTAKPAAVSSVVTSEMTELEALYARVNPSVVNIQVATKATASASSPDSVIPNYSRVGQGSGFVYDDQGHIVTNNHVVEGADVVYVTFSDDTMLLAKVIGTDLDSDLAVIKVDSDITHSVPLIMGDSDLLRVGQQVVAIGNPFGLAGSMSLGIISALGRSLPAGNSSTSSSYTIPDIIQTDAAINPGNSGGPLLDLDGKVVGVNAAIQSPVQGSAGVGFTIPVNIVKRVVPVLIANGAYEHPRLGITTFSLTQPVAEALNLPATQRGVIIVQITPGSPASRAGLRPSNNTVTVMGGQVPADGDIIIKIDDTVVKKFGDLISYLTLKTSVGQTVQLTVLRDGAEVIVPVTLDARPD
ncbi:MAG: S1C family serine protease [Anaerolineae bacterium]